MVYTISGNTNSMYPFPNSVMFGVDYPRRNTHKTIAWLGRWVET
jgi:hypothetical protein